MAHSGKCELKFNVSSVEETEMLAAKIASIQHPNWIILLKGDLGAGKTTFVRGFAQGMGIADLVSSPTYTLVQEYGPNAIGLNLYHFDVYRLKDSSSFLESGLNEYFELNGVCLIEWGEKIKDCLPENTWEITIKHSVNQECDKIFSKSTETTVNEVIDLTAIDGQTREFSIVFPYEESVLLALKNLNLNKYDRS